MMQRERKAEKQKQRAKVTKCAARTKRGTLCEKPAGFGTDHLGTGKCKYHGGGMRSHIAHAAREYAQEFLGTPMDISPFDAIIWCIKIRAGEIRWLSDRMAELDPKDWVENTLAGKQFHLFARERQRAMNDLARFSSMAVSLGIAERAVKLAESYGDLLAEYTKNLLQDLWPHLDEEGRAKAPQFVRMRLLQLDAGKKEQLALPVPLGATK
jgi:hypothetical protein